MKKVLLGTTALALFAAPAIAADMPVKAPLAVAAVAVHSWTGCYIGGHGGWLRARNEHTGVSVPGVDRGSNNASGALAGGQIGCDYQSGQWVVGVSVDGSWADASGSHTDLFQPDFYNRTVIRSLGTVSGRVGIAWDRGFIVPWPTLLYLTGGWAWERNRYETGPVGTSIVDGAANVTRNGWTLGVGSEYRVTNNISLFSQTNYVRYHDKDVNFAPLDATDSIREWKWVSKVGLNIRWGVGPVIARY